MLKINKLIDSLHDNFEKKYDRDFFFCDLLDPKYIEFLQENKDLLQSISNSLYNYYLEILEKHKQDESQRNDIYANEIYNLYSKHKELEELSERKTI